MKFFLKFILIFTFSFSPALAETFNSALKRAYENNPELNAERESINISEEEYKISISSYLPSITLEGSKSEEDTEKLTNRDGSNATITDVDPETKSIKVTQTLIDFGRGAELSKSKKFNRLKLPTFNKAIDDRYNKKKWYDLKKRPDVIIFEGWCVGAKSENNTTLNKTINSLERAKDQKKIWRKYVNNQLKSKYKNLYSQLNCLIYLKAKNFSLLQKWRLKQERKLWVQSKVKSKIMSRGDVLNFMQTYQRITQNMFRNMPKYASVIFNLNSNHQIKSAVYKKK